MITFFTIYFLTVPDFSLRACDTDTRLARNNIAVKYATEIYDYVILHVFLEREILGLLCNLS